MAGDIRRWVTQCGSCQQAKTVPFRHFHSRNHLHAGCPWQVLAIDLFGPLPETERSNTQILVVVDHFTRWYDAIPIPNGAAVTIARVLNKRIFSSYSVPEEIHSDQG